MTDETPPSRESISVSRDQAFDEIARVSLLTASYSRSIGEAAYRGDQTTVEVHLKQLRLCCLSMIKTYKDHLNGQAAAAKEHEVGRGHRADLGPGNGVA